MEETVIGQRVANLERSMDRQFDAMNHELWGNGQPGKIPILEASVKELQEFKWKLLGYGSAIASVIGFLTGGGDISLKHFLGH